MKQFLLGMFVFLSTSLIFAHDFVFPVVGNVMKGLYYGESPVRIGNKMFFHLDDKDTVIVEADFTNETLSVIPIEGKYRILAGDEKTLFLTWREPEVGRVVDSLDIQRKIFIGSKWRFPYDIFYCEYYQNGYFFVAKQTGEVDWDNYIYNIRTGEERTNKYLDYRTLPYDISPDKMLLMTGISFIKTSELVPFIPKEEIKARIGFPSQPFGHVSQIGFLTNNLFIAFHPDATAQFDYRKRIFTIDGEYSEDVTFFRTNDKGEREEIKICYFSPDLKRGLARLSMNTNLGVAIVDTTSFRDYLDSKNLLFRPTTAVSTESRVRVRENPNLEAQTFGHLEPGDELEVTDRSGIKVQIGEMNDWWYRIRRKSDGLTGWAYGAFLKLASYQGELGPRPEKDLR